MAEALGAVGSIVGLAELSASILRVGYSYIAKVKSAPKEVRQVLGEIASLELLLTNLEDIASDGGNDEGSKNDGVEQTMQSLQKSGAIKMCRTALEEAEMRIRACEQLEGQETRNLGRRLLWPFRETETKDLMLKLRNSRETFTAALAVDSTVSLRRIEAAQATMGSDISKLSLSVKSQQDSDLRETLSKWLCPENLNSNEELESALLTRHGHTGGWFFNCEAFRSWTTTEQSLLWLNGIAGCGKTVLMSTIIDKLRSGSYVNKEDAVTYFYCDHKDIKAQSPKGFFMILVLQLFRSSLDCTVDAQSLFESKSQKKEDSIRTDEYVALIQAMSKRFERVFVIIDALDENQNASVIMDHLKHLLRKYPYGEKLRVLVSSRNNFYMERLIADVANFRVALHEYCGRDITEFVTSEVQRRMSNRRQGIRQLESMIIKEITDHADGLFLQAKLQVEYICNLKTPRNIQNALKNLQSGLEPIYDKMIQDIVRDNSGDLVTVRNVLEWVLGAVAPLSLDALSHAVSLDLYDTRLDDENIADDLAEVCGSFACIDQNSAGDLFIRPSHLSVIEYFSSDHVALSGFHSFHTKSSETNLRLALICIKYLSLSPNWVL